MAQRSTHANRQRAMASKHQQQSPRMYRMLHKCGIVGIVIVWRSREERQFAVADSLVHLISERLKAIFASSTLHTPTQPSIVEFATAPHNHIEIVVTENMHMFFVLYCYVTLFIEGIFRYQRLLHNNMRKSFVRWFVSFVTYDMKLKLY